MRVLIILIITSLLIFLTNNSIGQDHYSDIDYLEIRFEYHHSILKDGHKLIRIIKSTDSCYFEVRDIKQTNDTVWFMIPPNKQASIPCSKFEEILTSFNGINNHDILSHHKDLVISHGYSLTLTLTNINSEVAYSLRSPQKTDEGIESFINTVDLLLELDETTWKKLIK
jgi:hypothetical protein